MGSTSGYHKWIWGTVFAVTASAVMCAAPAWAHDKTWVGMKADPALIPQVEFWKRIYGEITTDEGLLHDSKYIRAVYETLDLKKKNRHRVVAVAEAKWRNVLLALHKKWNQPGGVKEDELTADEKHVAELFKDIEDRDKFLDAAHRRRIRFQLGQKNAFARGLKISGRYLPQMEAIFKDYGLPVELTRLPFVESSFNVSAFSKVGASGIWQFMPSTGRLYLRVSEIVDERDDPIRATEAAAQLLKTNYEALGNWALAVTAYNHGRKGVLRAVRKIGSESLHDLILDYQRRSFGFASSNFYTCLLAAIEVEKNASKYFGDVVRDPPHPTTEVKLAHPTNLQVVVDLLRLEPAVVHALNPALDKRAWSGAVLVPAGYRLRLPREPQMSEQDAALVYSKGYETIPEALLSKVSRKPASKGRKVW